MGLPLIACLSALIAGLALCTVHSTAGMALVGFALVGVVMSLLLRSRDEEAMRSLLMGADI